MCHTPKTNDEPLAENVEGPRTLRFTLTDLLTFVMAIPVCIGVVAAVEFTACNQSYEWIGIHWWSDVRHFLIDSIGVPSGFVTGYVSFAMIDVPAWVCYAVVSFAFGLVRLKWALPVGVAFVVSIFVHDLMSDYFSGLQGLINLRLVSLFGVVVAASCFAVGRRIRGRSRVPDRRTGRVGVGLTCLALVASLGVSIYGWWLVDLDRKAGLEVQEVFRDANLQ